MRIMLQHPRVEIISNENLGNGLFKTSFRSVDIAKSLKPGNFVHIRVSSGMDPLFRRAMSVHWKENDTFSILFRVLGKGTRALSALREGEFVDVVGPLGNTFDTPNPDEKMIMVAGGTGLPPLHYFSRWLIEEQRFNRQNISFLFGVSSQADVRLVDDVEAIGLPLRISSDDGSVGHKGFVTDLLKQEIEKSDVATTRVCSCGPENMLREIIRICAEDEIRCQVSLEGNMPCGIGTCLGCVVQSSESDQEFKRICKEGPIFNGSEVKL